MDAGNRESKNSKKNELFRDLRSFVSFVVTRHGVVWMTLMVGELLIASALMARMYLDRAA